MVCERSHTPGGIPAPIGRRNVSCWTGGATGAQRNRDQATALKIASIREAGVEELDEREFELALAHLRVPELA